MLKSVKIRLFTDWRIGVIDEFWMHFILAHKVVYTLHFRNREMKWTSILSAAQS
jgi:hypothetical protein